MLLVVAVSNVNDWYNLGLHLRLEVAKLKEIEVKYHVYGAARMKTEMFDLWLKSCPNASWHKLVSALNAIGEKRVAKEVESNYCKQLPGISEYFICIVYNKLVFTITYLYLPHLTPGSHASTVSSDACASYAATSHHCLGKKYQLYYNFHFSSFPLFLS